VRRKIERCRRAGKGWRTRRQPASLAFVVRARSYLWIALMLATPSSTLAQQDSARIEGTARSALNGRPLAGVMVTVRDTRIFSVTDSTGTFALGGLPSGRRGVRIRYGDSLSYTQDVTLQRGKTLILAVLLDVSAVELAPVVVEAQSVAALRSLVAFYDRKRLGFGRYYTPEELARRRGLRLTTLLLEAGVQVRCRLALCVPVVVGPRLTGDPTCIPTLYLDGLPTFANDVNEFWADELAALEIYKRAGDVPPEFNRDYLGGCGAIVMWSRR